MLISCVLMESLKSFLCLDFLKMMMQQEQPDDYVLATGRLHSVRDFVEMAFREVGVEIAWSGQGVEEVGVDAATGRVLVRIDPRYFRPTEVDQLQGDASKARRILGWEPTITLDEMIHEMVAADLDACRRPGPDHRP